MKQRKSGEEGEKERRRERRREGGTEGGKEEKHISVSVRALAGNRAHSDDSTDLKEWATYKLRKQTRMLSAQRQAVLGRGGNS